MALIVRRAFRTMEGNMADYNARDFLISDMIDLRYIILSVLGMWLSITITMPISLGSVVKNPIFIQIQPETVMYEAIIFLTSFP